ncbi:MAG: 23S rRNA (uracil(1939)-C(5))-methyltransferase RlmD [Gammaproteobacteria bacterium]|nr:MAG: 23S rRNA (uracil(1939)-C(5))-methyltransferase RlmD [Gammaproteobacteria bacterium]
MVKRRRRRQLPEPCVVRIESMSHEGRGIAHIDGKTVFVFGAIEGEEVRIQIRKTNRNYDEAVTLDVIQPSELRIVPKCEAYGVCGGCSLQHMHNDEQVAFKQRSLLEMMRHAGIEIDKVMPPLRSHPWGYRRKARLGVKFVRKKDRVLVGFRERNTPFLTDMSRCEVLIPQVGERLRELANLIEDLDARETIPQIEVAADDSRTALVFRHLKPLSKNDTAKLVDYAKRNDVWIQLQPAGPESIVNLYPQQQALYFAPLQNEEINIRFDPVDFTQVNAEINHQMVAQALHFLELNKTDRVLDLFCGLGNFTLPMARRCLKVTGIEGDAPMVKRARQNALAHEIHNSEYFVADLSSPDPDIGWIRQQYDKILLDPPRLGAPEIVQLISSFGARIIVYISCQPASLVRDSKIICDSGYRCTHLGIMDMFPQTAHVESMSVFERSG